MRESKRRKEGNQARKGKPEQISEENIEKGNTCEYTKG